MATTLYHTLPLNHHHHHRNHHHNHHFHHRNHHQFNPKTTHYLTLSCTTSHHHHNSTTTTTTTQETNNPPRTGRFLTNSDVETLGLLEKFKSFHRLRDGYLLIRVMKEEEVDMVVGLLAESFAESMLLPGAYATFLGFLIKQYLIERRTLMPHTATLIAYFKEDGREGDDDGVELAGTVEVSFNQKGANVSPPTPTPPKDSPYICNMTVKKSLRRKGIGWHLLKASEDLISQMSSSREIYLHCRMIDSAPFNMYTKAGYSVVVTDTILILLTLQRRKHLMRKKITPAIDDRADSDGFFSGEDRELDKITELKILIDCEKTLGVSTRDMHRPWEKD